MKQWKKLNTGMANTEMTDLLGGTDVWTGWTHNVRHHRVPGEKLTMSENTATAEFQALSSNDDRKRFLDSVTQESTLDHVGREVMYWGQRWEITGINYLGDYDIERTDKRGLVKSSCILGLPTWHPHFASLVDA